MYLQAVLFSHISIVFQHTFFFNFTLQGNLFYFCYLTAADYALMDFCFLLKFFVAPILEFFYFKIMYILYIYEGM